MKIKRLCAALMLGLCAQTASAQTLEETAQCQAVLQYVNAKLNTTPQYSQADIAAVRNGLFMYNEFLQTQIISPSLLQASNGDLKTAAALQVEMEKFQATLVLQYDQQYPGPSLHTDHALSLTHCYNQTPMPEANRPTFQNMLEVMLRLAQGT